MRARTGRLAAGTVGAVVLALGAVACGSGSGGRSGTSGGGATTAAATGEGTELEGDLTVAAATSLHAAFDEIVADFEDAHPGVDVQATYDSSGTLSDQIVSGAPLDVFASADEANIEKVAAEDLTSGEPAMFAGNELVIITKPGNPEGIESLSDLADVDGVVALCAEDAPCGTYAAEALDDAAVTLDESSVTRGQNAGATVAAVTDGDAVAGIVYVTDALDAGDDADSVEIPQDQNVIATYPITALASADDAVAQAFIDFVLSDDGQQVLADHGFLPPS